VVAAALLVAATILFVVATTIERSQARAGESREANAVERPAGEAGEHSESETTESASNTTTKATEERGSPGESGEELFGVNPESAGLTATVAAVSLLLAALLVARPRNGLLVAVVVVGLVLAALDIREGIHQADEFDPGLLVMALGTGLLHLGAAAAAVAALRDPRTAAIAS
jgi:uncharacterized membrane protein YdbT with pleckstrin-like domain